MGKDKRRGQGVKWVDDPHDPNFANYRYFASPQQRETVIGARLRQVETVEARKAGAREPNRRQRQQHGAQPVYPEISAAKFASLLGKRLWAADDLADGLQRLPRDDALLHRHISLNGKVWLGWLVFDVDHPDAAHAHERGGLPSPNIIVVNPNNGHAHVAYRLSIPIKRSAATAFAFYDDVRRGLRRRLGADRNYHGPTAKNPLHCSWRTTWARSTPYSLEDLNGYLTFEDKRPEATFETSAADVGGRNTAIFDLLRRNAFTVTRYHRGKALIQALEAIAKQVNTAFEVPLSSNEIAAIVRSVARWVSRKYSDERFSRIQSHRAQSRWKTHEALSKTKPWEKVGKSRSTWYRHRRRDR